MLQVVRALVSKETVMLVKWLLHMAMTGQIRGLAIVFRLVDGPDEVMFTGIYRLRPENGVTAASRMYWKASQATEPLEMHQ